jgi:hypothetical protein
MFHWFADRPPHSEQPMRDRPSIALTAEERQAFDSLSRELNGRSRVLSTGDGSRWSSVPLALPFGILIVVASAAWTVAWLSVSVPVSFVGVLAMAAGMASIVEGQRFRLRPGGAAAPPAASPPQPHAPRRPGL